MTLDDLLARVEAQRSAKLAERQKHTETLNGLRDILEGDHARALDASEQPRMDSAIAERSRIDAEVAPLTARIDQLRAEVQADHAYDRLSREVHPVPGIRAGGAVVGAEARVYSANSARSGVSFFRDMYAARFDFNPDAVSRLTQHQAESRALGEIHERAGTTGTVGSLVVPNYMPQLVALSLRNGRPLANLIPSMELPEGGMTITVPRITTASSAGPQATQNQSVSNTDVAVTDLVINVNTISGQQDVSRQLLERGGDIDQIIYADLTGAHASNYDAQIINGTGSGGTCLGFLQTANIIKATAFGALVTATTFYSKLAGAIASAASAGATIHPNLIAMHPRRWGWLQAQVDSGGRPLVLTPGNGPYNATALNLAPGAQGATDGIANGATIVGSILGLPVVTDANIPTNLGGGLEDAVLVIDNTKMLQWQQGDGTPTQLKFEQTNGGNLETKLVIYSYVAFSAGRYLAATSQVGGVDAASQGLQPPTF